VWLSAAKGCVLYQNARFDYRNMGYGLVLYVTWDLPYK